MPFARHWLIAALIYFNVAASAWAVEAGDVLGRYWNPDRDGIVEIYSDGDLVHGRVIWSAAPLVDERNRDRSLRGRDMLGIPFLTGFRFDGEDRWTGGRVYAPDNGRTYKGHLWLKAGDLKMRGFVGVSALGRTATFTRYPASAELPEVGYAFDPVPQNEGELR